MSGEPLVSIVLPTYNGERYLEGSIRSCLDQTFRDLELILVDDASTDGTPAIIERYAGADARVRSIRQDANRKLPASMNAGFLEARGEYLTWTSDDNLYRPNAVEEMVRHLETHPQAGMVYADYSQIDAEGKEFESVRVGPTEDLVASNVIGGCFLYRREVKERLGGYAEDLFLAEDYDYWLRASISFRLEPLHRDLYQLRRHGSSLTATRSERVALATEQALSRNLPRMGWLDSPLLAKGYMTLAELALRRGEGLLARRRALKALAQSPGHVLGKAQRGIFATVVLGRTFSGLLRKPYLRLKKMETRRHGGH